MNRLLPLPTPFHLLFVVTLLIGLPLPTAAGQGPDVQALQTYLTDRQLGHAEGELQEMFSSPDPVPEGAAASGTTHPEGPPAHEEDEAAPFERLSLAAQEEQLRWRALTGLAVALGLTFLEAGRRWRRRRSRRENRNVI